MTLRAKDMEEITLSFWLCIYIMNPALIHLSQKAKFASQNFS